MKKNCLVIIPGIPYPPVDGHKLKIYNLILILSKHYHLHLITISKDNLSSEQLAFITANSYKSKHFKIRPLATLLRLFKSIFSDVPLQVGYFTFTSIKKYIKNNTQSDSLVVLNLIRTCEYLDVLSDKYILLDMVDALSKSYLKSKETTSSKLYSFIYGVEGNRLVDYEKKCLSKANLTLCVNQEDALKLSSYGNVKWLPNGVNNSLFNYSKIEAGYGDYIVFFGAMFYQPNIDAVIWFDKNVLDHLDPNIKLVVIGGRPSTSILNIAKKRGNVKVTGFIGDPYSIINSCFAVIAPMQNGGGIQNKILETMGMGKVNILTSYAADPIIGAEDNKHFIVENEPVKMAKKINDIYSFRSSYTTIGQNAIELIKANYTWEAYEEKIISHINQRYND